MTRTSLVAALSLLVNLPALAVEAPAAKAPTPKAAEAAVAVKPQAADLARLMVTKDDWSRAMDGLSRDTMAQLQGHPGSKMTLPAGFDKKVRGEMEKVLPYEDLVGMHAKELSASYSDKELEELVAFHKSPLGQKYLKAAPVEAEKVAGQTQQRFGKQMPDVMKRLTADLPHPDPKKEAAGHAQMPAGHPAMPPADGKAAPAAKPAPAKPAK
jgi:hypothetical protein